MDSLTKKNDAEVLRLLVLAREYVAGGWTQGAFARTVYGIACGEESPEATCFCTWGAVRRARNFTGFEDFKGRGAVTALWQIINEDRLPDDHESIPTWNDVPGRTQEQVLAVFDKAIIKQQQKIGGH